MCDQYLQIFHPGKNTSFPHSGEWLRVFLIIIIRSFSNSMKTKSPTIKSSAASVPLHNMSRRRVYHLPHHLYIFITCASLHILVQTNETITLSCKKIKKTQNLRLSEARHQKKINTQMIKIPPLALYLRLEAAFARKSFVRRKNEFLIMELNQDFLLSISLDARA